MAQMERVELGLANAHGPRIAVRTERIKRNVWAEQGVPWEDEDYAGYTRLRTHRMKMGFHRRFSGAKEEEGPYVATFMTQYGASRELQDELQRFLASAVFASF